MSRTLFIYQDIKEPLRAEAIQRAMVVEGGYPVCALRHEELSCLSPEGLRSLVQTHEAVLFLNVPVDGFPEKIRDLFSGPMVFIHSSGTSRAPAQNIMAKHGKLGPLLWEDIPPGLDKEDVETVLLPPAAIETHDPKNPFAGTIGFKNVVVLAPPTPHAVCRELQREYVSKPRRNFQLLVLNPAQDSPDFSSRIDNVTAWYVPSGNGETFWCFDHTTVLYAGGMVACAAPPNPLKKYVCRASSLDELEDRLAEPSSRPKIVANVRIAATRDFLNKLKTYI